MGEGEMMSVLTNTPRPPSHSIQYTLSYDVITCHNWKWLKHHEFKNKSLTSLDIMDRSTSSPTSRPRSSIAICSSHRTWNIQIQFSNHHQSFLIIALPKHQYSNRMMPVERYLVLEHNVHAAGASRWKLSLAPTTFTHQKPSSHQYPLVPTSTH